MRKLLVLMAGVLAIGALAVTPTVAQSPSQTVLTVTPTVSDNRAGTKKKPRNVNLKVKTHWETTPGVERPIITGAKARFPKGAVWNGSKFPKCSQNTLARKGVGGCPKGAVIGKGGGVAFADTVFTRPKITIVNGGGKRVYLYTVLNNPARVQAPVPGVIRKTRGKFSYELTLTVPRVLQVVAGVPIQLRDITLTAGKTRTVGKGKRRKKLGIFQSTSCPSNRKWPFEVETFYDTSGAKSSSGVVADTIACRPAPKSSKRRSRR